MNRKNFFKSLFFGASALFVPKILFTQKVKYPIQNTAEDVGNALYYKGHVRDMKYDINMHKSWVQSYKGEAIILPYADAGFYGLYKQIEANIKEKYIPTKRYWITYDCKDRPRLYRDFKKIKSSNTNT